MLVPNRYIFGQLFRGTVYAGIASTGTYFINEYLNHRHAIIMHNNQLTHESAEVHKHEHETWIANDRQGVEPKWKEPTK